MASFLSSCLSHSLFLSLTLSLTLSFLPPLFISLEKFFPQLPDFFALVSSKEIPIRVFFIQTEFLCARKIRARKSLGLSSRAWALRFELALGYVTNPNFLVPL